MPLRGAKPCLLVQREVQEMDILTSASKVPVEASLTALSLAASAVLLTWQIKASITTALSPLALILCHRDVILSIAPLAAGSFFLNFRVHFSFLGRLSRCYLGLSPFQGPL